MLREADRRAKQDAAALMEHKDPNRLPLPDPWQFLIDLPDTSLLSKKICRAAQSQFAAFRQICRLATGVATSNTDWQQKALKAAKAGDKRQSDYAAIKAGYALWKFKLARSLVREWSHDNLARKANAKAWQERWRTQRVHRGERGDAEKPKPLPQWSTIQRDFPIETLLVFRWVRVRSDGPPGFMFWRNEALTKLVLALREMPRSRFCEQGRDYIKNLRQNLQLIPVSDAACMIWDVEITSRSEGGWLVKGMERTCNLIFQEGFPPWNRR